MDDQRLAAVREQLRGLGYKGDVPEHVLLHLLQGIDAPVSTSAPDTHRPSGVYHGHRVDMEVGTGGLDEEDPSTSALELFESRASQSSTGANLATVGHHPVMRTTRPVAHPASDAYRTRVAHSSTSSGFVSPDGLISFTHTAKDKEADADVDDGRAMAYTIGGDMFSTAPSTQWETPPVEAVETVSPTLGDAYAHADGTYSGSETNPTGTTGDVDPLSGTKTPPRGARQKSSSFRGVGAGSAGSGKRRVQPPVLPSREPASRRPHTAPASGSTATTTPLSSLRSPAMRVRQSSKDDTEPFVVAHRAGGSSEFVDLPRFDPTMDVLDAADDAPKTPISRTTGSRRPRVAGTTPSSVKRPVRRTRVGSSPRAPYKSPAKPAGPKKCDPVTRHFQIQHQRAVHEFGVRHMRSPRKAKPSTRKPSATIASAPAPSRRRPVSARTRSVNAYVAPTDKRRDRLRLEIRAQMLQIRMGAPSPIKSRPAIPSDYRGPGDSRRPRTARF